MSLKDIQIKEEYRSLEDNIVCDFLVPTLKEAVLYKRAVGFFSSTALIEITKGISGLIENNGRIEIIASPYLSVEDLEAIKAGYDLKKIIESRLLHSLNEPLTVFEEKRLNLLANLIAYGYLQIKIAFLSVDNTVGMYHEKFGLIYDDYKNIIAFSGSMNESLNAFSCNYESIDIFCSWTQDENRVQRKEVVFNELWSNTKNQVKVIEFPNISQEILKRYRKNDSLDTTLDALEYRKIQTEAPFLTIPYGIELHPYQKTAINAWVNNGFRGIFDMATGTGKTITALGALLNLYERERSLGVFIVCPYIHLVDQWAEEMEEWGCGAIVAHSQAADKQWSNKLVNAFKRFRRTGKSFVCIVTNSTFRDERIQNIMHSINSQMPIVLVVDEVHNFGAKTLRNLLPQEVGYRLGLSATVERHNDKKGTEAIRTYFGKTCLYYPIEQAIREGALVPYEYHPIIISLNGDELEEYQRITKQISKNIKIKNGKITITEIGQQLLFKRSRLIAGAEEKLPKLKELLEPIINESHILVYCGATRGFEEFYGQKERQIDRVEKIIGRELNMSTHRFTSEENISTRRLLKEGFADGEYQVITAIKCLDEGVDIPNIQTAFILASSRNPKEFIQRRGRVLRKAPGKDRAVIYDFVTLPRPINMIRFGDFESDRALVIGELARMYEFGRNSINVRVADEIINTIKQSYYIEDIDNEQLIGLMEAEYGEEAEAGIAE